MPLTRNLHAKGGAFCQRLAKALQLIVALAFVTSQLSPKTARPVAASAGPARQFNGTGQDVMLRKAAPNIRRVMLSQADQADAAATISTNVYRSDDLSVLQSPRKPCRMNATILEGS